MDIVHESSFGLFQSYAEPRHRFSTFHPEYIRCSWTVHWRKASIQIGRVGCRRILSGEYVYISLVQNWRSNLWIAFEPESPLSLQLLAAHLYYRALLTVPALIRSWISDCTDKQLLTRVVDYTSSYFSPGIIRAELALVRQPDASSELSTTENLTIKVSPASGEVTASYTVDEQPLELSIRMPSDWPLHRLEVRDTRMVGVSEDKWRAWILGVQQIVWQQVKSTTVMRSTT